MKTSRRDFLKNASSIIFLSTLPEPEFWELLKSKPILRIIIGSDSHYGQAKTNFEEMANTFIQKVNAFSKINKCDFCLINGDIIHDNPDLMPEAKLKFNDLKLSYYVSKGNHDRVSEEKWEEIWGIPANYSFVKNKVGFIIANTSDEKGKYLAPDLVWLKAQLSNFKHLKTVILVLHIPQAKWTENGIETPAFFELLGGYPNVKAVLHGHEHDQDGIIMHEGIPYIFDSHIGGSWGTAYRGFRVLEISKRGQLITYMMNPDIEVSRSEF